MKERERERDERIVIFNEWKVETLMMKRKLQERMMMMTMMKRYEKKCEEQVLIY